MSNKVNLGWLQDASGERIAPKTFISQVLSEDGKTLDKVLENLPNTPSGGDGECVGQKGEGENSAVFNNYSSHATAENTTAFGERTTASAKDAFATGCETIASGFCSHVEGHKAKAEDSCSHAEGQATTASGQCSHAEGSYTEANGPCSHAEGAQTKAENDCSHAEGSETVASGQCSHAEGHITVASGFSSHAEGGETVASGFNSHAEGYYTAARGKASHAEGYRTAAIGAYSHAEGYQTTTIADYSHAEGYYTEADGYASHAEGSETWAKSEASHAEGHKTIANSFCSHAEGYCTSTPGLYCHVQGIYNDFTVENSYQISWLHMVGNGESDSERSNAHTLDAKGNAEFAGDVIAYGCGGNNPISLKALANGGAGGGVYVINSESYTYGDDALAAILSGKQILVKTLNFNGDEVTGLYGNFMPVIQYQLPQNGNDYLTLFYLKDGIAQNLLTALTTGSFDGVFGEITMMLSQSYDECPLKVDPIK